MASSSSSKAGESYIGSLISITSKYEIRYEGFLYHINSQDSTIGLKDVRSYGTEGRKKDGPQIPPSDKVYECILFRGSDIKDLQVRSPPPAQTEEQIYNDPAIIQNHSALSSSTAVGVQAQHTPALTTKAHSGALPSFQPANHVVLKISFPGYSKCRSISFHANAFTRIPWDNFPAVHGFISLNSSESYAANPLNPNFSSSLPLVQYAISPDTSSFFSLKTPTRSHATSLPIHRLTMSSIPVSSQDINTTKTLAVADPMAMHPAQSMPYLMPSYVGSTSSSVLTPPPSLLSPHHFLQSRPPVLSHPQKLYPDQQDVAVLTPLSSTSPPLLSTPASQPPLLPLPGSVQQHKYLTSQFTEEFDFEAMNEKFKKDEVWGYLGKANQREKVEGMEDNTTDQSMVDKEALAVVPNLDPKPAYKKDEFFDSISSNIRTQRWNGQNCFSERMKLDSETFGNLHLRPNLGHRGLGSGRGDTYHTSRGRGRGYGYRGRGRGYIGF
ncbi:hypothetical protein OIU78_010866 [Salix suchowensis]|nr:hypothetical protein OIU78_010866 [Salix suchowensis]